MSGELWRWFPAFHAGGDRTRHVATKSGLFGFEGYAIPWYCSLSAIAADGSTSRKLTLNWTAHPIAVIQLPTSLLADNGRHSERSGRWVSPPRGLSSAKRAVGMRPTERPIIAIEY